MRKTQEEMSSAASNYDVPRLVIGTLLAILICSFGFLSLPAFRPVTPAGVFFTLTLSFYTVLMFASSYVEEEHNFWYWMTSGWFMFLFLGDMRKAWYGGWMVHPALMALATHRIIRRWNQTGQKYAGADDIVNSGIFHGNNAIVLWTLIGTTYLDLTIRIARHIARSIATFDSEQKIRNVEIESTDQNRMIGTIAVMPLVGTAFIFKLAFTAKDSPELTSGITGSLMDSVEVLNLVSLARMVFGGIALSGIWIIFAEWQRSNKRAKMKQEGNGCE